MDISSSISILVYIPGNWDIATLNPPVGSGEITKLTLDVKLPEAGYLVPSNWSTACNDTVNAVGLPVWYPTKSKNVPGKTAVCPADASLVTPKLPLWDDPNAVLAGLVVAESKVTSNPELPVLTPPASKAIWVIFIPDAPGP